MLIYHTIEMGEEELKQALLDYVNKNLKGTPLKEVTNLRFFNGEIEEKTLFTKLKLGVSCMNKDI